MVSKVSRVGLSKLSMVRQAMATYSFFGILDFPDFTNYTTAQVAQDYYRYPAKYVEGFNINSIQHRTDGVQRLNAIIGFVFGEFPVEYKGEQVYFDPMTNNETFHYLREGKIKKHSNLLDKDVCRDFGRIPIPVISTGQDNEAIELIFSRINSTGHKMSAQDLRQSSAVGEFPDLVRRISSRVRKDFTYFDEVNLCDMPKISVGPEKYGYGVDIDSIFWRRHDLINSANLKESKDEEIIESLVATVLLGDKFKKSKKALDNLYNSDEKLGKMIEHKISDFGKDALENKFSEVFDVFDTVFNQVNSNFSKYVFDEKRISGKDECFKVVFLALYRLADDGYVVTDSTAVANAMKGLRNILKEFVRGTKIDYEQVTSVVDQIYAILKPKFSKRLESREDPALVAELNKRLSYSKLEMQMTEYKIGVSDFSSNELNCDCIHRIAKTLVAMANTHNEREMGLIVIGIADNEKAYKDWAAVYDRYGIVRGSHFIPGVDAEAKKLCGNTDKYLRKLRAVFSNEPISDNLKSFVLENLECVDYNGASLILIKSKNVGEVSLYNGMKFVRQGNETIKVNL